jgi:hypothetical protein
MLIGWLRIRGGGGLLILLRIALLMISEVLLFVGPDVVASSAVDVERASGVQLVQIRTSVQKRVDVVSDDLIRKLGIEAGMGWVATAVVCAVICVERVVCSSTPRRGLNGVELASISMSIVSEGGVPEHVAVGRGVETMWLMEVLEVITSNSVEIHSSSEAKPIAISHIRWRIIANTSECKRVRRVGTKLADRR